MSPPTEADRYRDVADAAWRWVLAQVQYADDGPWVPVGVAVDGGPVVPPPPGERDGMHSGVGGLAYVLAQISHERDWTAEESELAAAVGERLRSGIATRTDCSWFDGLVSDIGVLDVLGQTGIAACVARLQELGDTGAWPTYNDATLGTAAVVTGGLVAGTPAGLALAGRAADRLLAEAEPTPAGLNWLFAPRRHSEVGPDGAIVQMPNWSHGLAGVVGTLAAAGTTLHRADLVDAARRGAEHLVTLADSPSHVGPDPGGHGFVVPRRIPPKTGEHDVTWNWCHGPPGTAGAFAALGSAGVTEVAGRPPEEWRRRCLDATRRSGIPDRLRPGFWDNDGRCCGTAGVGEIFLDAWETDRRHPEDLAFAIRLGDALVDRAVVDGEHAYWRFVEHTAPEPLLPPGVGWQQGGAGIAAYLFHLAQALGRGGSVGQQQHDRLLEPGRAGGGGQPPADPPHHG